MLWSLLKPLWKSPVKLMLEILSGFFYRWEGRWKVKGCLAFYSHLVEVWHSVFKMTVGSYDHKASPVFLKQYNLWEVGNNVQPNCCEILVGARSCASAWDAVSLCRGMWRGCSCWWWRRCPAERAKLSSCCWLSDTGYCRGSGAHSYRCVCRRFPGK